MRHCPPFSPEVLTLISITNCLIVIYLEIKFQVEFENFKFIDFSAVRYLLKIIFIHLIDDFLWRLDENNKLINKNVSNWKYANEDFKFDIDGKDEKVHIIALGSNENGEDQ